MTSINFSDASMTGRSVWSMLELIASSAANVIVIAYCEKFSTKGTNLHCFAPHRVFRLPGAPVPRRLPMLKSISAKQISDLRGYFDEMAKNAEGLRS